MGATEMSATPPQQPDRKPPSNVRVGIMWTTFGALLASAFLWLVGDATGRRDAQLQSHEIRIQTLERADTRREAQFEEILRRLENIEMAVKTKER